MITELRIRGLGVIDEAAVAFAPGFTVLTGETGAGKTMVLTGLGLITGSRGDPGDVRSGATRASVDGEWRLSPRLVSELTPLLDEVGAELEEDGDECSLVLARTIAVEGRSRAFAGGRSVPAGVLAEVADHLLTVHGQADQALLRDQGRQRQLLDTFGGPAVGEARTGYRELFDEWRALNAELRELVDHRDERQREAALLRHGIDEIAGVAPVPGEDEDLKAQAQILAHATDLVVDVTAAQALLVGGEDPADVPATTLIAQASKMMERAQNLDPSLESLAEQLVQALESVSAVAGELGTYASGVSADPERQAAVDERRSRIAGLKQRYGPGLDDVLAWWEHAQVTVGLADGADDHIERLRDRLRQVTDEVLRAAHVLSAARAEAASRFQEAVTDELRTLAMPDAEFIVQVHSSNDTTEFGAEGADNVTMLLRPHAGSEPRPLGKGASGGELSRIMLAIEVVLAGVHAVPTFVFDEVDAGVGGRVAVEIGRRLARLARTSQVIVVTHLPQVAAFADRHIVITKESDGRVTSASVVGVDGDERVQELVRMLSGLEGSQSGAEHASELLDLASAERG